MDMRVHGMNVKEQRDLFGEDYETVRPFRLWNPGTGEFVAHRCYKYLRNCHLAALIECRWSAIGTTLEILDVTEGRMKMVGSYTRRVNDIRFLGGDDLEKKLN